MKTISSIIAIILAVIIVGGLFLFVNRPTQEQLPSDIMLHEPVSVSTSSQSVKNLSENQNEQSSSPDLMTSQPSFRVSKEYLSHINENLLYGGVPKDGIPAIDNPIYLSVDDAGLEDDDIVFGIDYGGLVAAYPKDIMYQHEIVNEKADGKKLSVTYCPLTGSVIGYLGKNLGVSGRLYNSNLVFYDRETDINYPQILGVSLNGSDAGIALDTFAVEVTTWKKWKAAHPDTKVLSRQTGFNRNYDRNPYPGYEDALRVWFPLSAQSDKFHSKEIVFGIEAGQESFAVTRTHAKASGNLTIDSEMGEIFVTYDPDTDTLSAVDSSGSHLKGFDLFWFAWYAFHPDTKVIS